jgi:hypothetical protein
MSLLKKIGKIAGGIIGGPVGAAIGGAAGSLIGGKKGKKAASVQSATYEAAAQEQRDALGRVTGYQQPYRDAGAAAVNKLMGVNAGDYSGFESSPDYLFALEHGGRAVDRSAAARGGLNSGNTLIAQQRFGQGLATQNLNNYRNSLFQTAGIGQGATNQLTGAELTTAGNVGNMLIGSGDARASGIVAQGNGLSSAIEQAAGTAGDYFGKKLVKRTPVAGANALYGYNARQRPATNTAVG